MAIFNNGAIPLYYQLKVWLSEQIERGLFPPGSQIPSEHELCERFNLSRGTVRQAIKELISDGRLYLVRGRGTFVADLPQGHWPLVSLVSIAETLQDKKIPFETPVLEICPLAASTQVAARLKIEAGAPVIYLKRLRVVEGEPVILFSSYLPEKSALQLYQTDLNNVSLYRTLEEVCQIQVTYMDHTLSVRMPSEEEASLLQIGLNSPVMLSEEVAYDPYNNPVEYSTSLYRSDRGFFYIRSERMSKSHTRQDSWQISPQKTEKKEAVDGSQ
jgi:GntR family transcriptional regulator